MRDTSLPVADLPKVVGRTKQVVYILGRWARGVVAIKQEGSSLSQPSPPHRTLLVDKVIGGFYSSGQLAESQPGAPFHSHTSPTDPMRLVKYHPGPASVSPHTGITVCDPSVVPSPDKTAPPRRPRK